MNSRCLQFIFLVMGALVFTSAIAGQKDKPSFKWMTVVNNNDVMPPLEERNFNSYNQPSVNNDGLVVFRARSRGGPPLGPPTHGIYLRDMSEADSEIASVLDKTTHVPHPNNLGALFVETPSFPRIDMEFETIATRGNHQPSWRYNLGDGTETRAGTTGIYANPYGKLITGATKLGDVSGFHFFGVPEFNNIRFEVFPGAPAVTAGHTIVFKGNYTVNDIGKTGVYFRDLYNEHTGGISPAIMIANNSDTLIPGTVRVFGSTAPPSAARGNAVFAGFDNEDAPTLGGIYLAPLQFAPPLTPLVQIGESVPGAAPGDTFNNLGEGSAFDGRHVGFWGAWGTETRTVRLYCAEEGNKDRIAYCNQALVCKDTGETLGHPDSICDDVNDAKFGVSCYQDKQVPLNQGFFIHDIKNRRTHVLAKTGSEFDDLLFWNFSGKAPCVGGGHSDEGAEDDGELARWRSSAFVAVAGRGTAFKAVFKARSGEFGNGVYADPVDGLYLTKGPGRSEIITVLDTTMDGRALDPEAPTDSTIIELGLEREGLRGNWLAINASMGIEGGEEEDGVAGIYISKIK